jgi:formylglycine-generating enzyme required for sulfatase activity
VSWYDAAAYCNWLSDQEKIPEDQWCYERNAQGEYAEGMKVKANIERLSGYRLPREEEWEYTCRAGTVTAWTHGSEEGMLVHYAWWAANAGGTMHPVGRLKPNGLGLFDVHGNAWQWCDDPFEKKDNKVIQDVNNNQNRILRGGAFCFDGWVARSAHRYAVAPHDRSSHFLGFRVAFTWRRALAPAASESRRLGAP